MLNEALNAVKLQNGGTFRNVLARKLDGVIIPIFAGIIGFIDRNYNLNLIRDKADKPATFHFWLDMFRDPQIMQFHYDEMAVREQVPGAGGRMSEEDFRCHLPFSWLIKETFDSQWDNAKRIASISILSSTLSLISAIILHSYSMQITTSSVCVHSSVNWWQIHLSAECLRVLMRKTVRSFTRTT